MTRDWNSLILACCALALLAPCAGADEANSVKTKELVAVLQSPAASIFEKSRACEQLGEIGDKTAVPSLAALLSDEQLSAYARSGLEGIPDPSAAAALRAALATVKGNSLAGVINSLAVLRDAQSVGALRPLAENPASGVAGEALLALGRIDTADSVAILRRALHSDSEAARASAAAGCLLAAAKELADGHLKLALTLNVHVLDAKVPASYRAAAAHGAILAHESGQVAFLMKQLRSSEAPIRDAAFLTVPEIPGAELADALNAGIKKASPALELQLLNALAACHNARSYQILESKAADSEPSVRLTALKVLSIIATPAQAPGLIRILERSQSPAESDLAEAALKHLEGGAVDDLALKSLQSATDARARVSLIKLLAARDATNAVSEMLKQASNADDTVSLAALRGLGEVAGTDQTDAIIELMKQSKTAPGRDAAATAIIRSAEREGSPEVSGKVVLAEFQRSDIPVEKNALIRILVALGWPGSLPALETAMRDSNESVAANAIQNLAYWPDPAPAEALLALAETSANPATRESALASVTQLAANAVDEGQRSNAVVIVWMRRASVAAQSVPEKRQVISILGRLKEAESFRLLLPYLDQPDLQAEAGIAVLRIAPALAGGEDSAAVKRALESIAATAKTPDVREQATKLAQAISH